MGANNSNSSSGKQSSQALRDKLNQSLKLRLSRRAGETAAASGNVAAPEPESVEPTIEALQELPNASLKSGQADRSKQFLDDIESEAQKEVEKMDHMPLFHPEAAQGDKPGAGEPSQAEKQDPIAPALTAQPPAAAPAPTRQDPLRDEQSDAEGPMTMNQEDEAKSEPSSSLLNLLKSSKGEVKGGSFLKAPRQSAQSAHGAGAPDEEEEKEEEEEKAAAGPKKDTFLKAPRQSRQAQSEQVAQATPAPAAAPTHEQEIIDAIRRGDAEWIRANAHLDGLSDARQEMILIFSLAQPKCIEALFELGLKFNPDPKTGLALRTAISKKHYAALDLMKGRKARIDLDTLKAVAAWKRSQQTRSTGAHEAEPSGSMEGEVAKKLQDDFDQFLIEHAKEIGEDDLSAFAKPEPEQVHEPESESESEVLADLADLDDLALELTGDEAPTPRAPAPSRALDEAARSFAPFEEDPSLSDFDSLSLGSHDPLDGPQPPAGPGDADADALTDTLTPREEPADPSAEPAAEKARPHRASPDQGRSNRTAMEQDMPSTPTPPSERKASTGAAGSTAMERARNGMLEKVMAEKQQLEMRVIELQMYQEAAESLEQERDRLMEDLEDSQAAHEQLGADIRSMKAQYANFDKIKSNFEAQIAKAKTDAAHAFELAEQEKDELRQTGEATSGALAESQRRESELKKLNAELAAELSAKTAELANRKPPVPDAPDWLAGTDKEAHLRKQMFVESVIAGESKLLENIAKNTSVDNEMAHLSLIFAAQANQIKCAQWLVDNMDVHPGYGGELATRRAVEAGHHAMVRWLAARGADIHHAEEFALRLAADRDDVEMIDLLVELGANPRAARERALVEAASEASWKAFRALLGHGCTGLDEHGEPMAELAEHEEAQELIAWVAHQRKLAKALDPDFAKRQGRR